MVKFTSDIPPEEKETTVDKWDWNAVKNALDDSVRKFLVSQNGFKEDNTLMNGRLLISTIAVLVSLYAIAYDWFYPFPQSRSIIIVSVILYFIGIGILTIYTTYIEKGCFTAAKQTSDGKTNLWRCSSKQKPNHDHIYVLDIDLIEGNTNKKRSSTHETSVAKYFDEDGLLLTKAFHNDLCKFFTSVADDKKKH